MKKRNCWEVKQCGREPGGTHEKDLGICPERWPGLFRQVKAFLK